jgi:hypothetical protein
MNKPSLMTAVMKHFLWRVLGLTGAYLAAILLASMYLTQHQPVGVALYALSLVPAVPILVVIVSVGIYLRDEKDEYLRWITVKSLLWASGITLTAATVASFLGAVAQVRPASSPPAIVAFWATFGFLQATFWGVFGVAQAILHVSNGGSDD